MSVTGIDNYVDFMNASVVEITSKQNRRLLYALWDNVVPKTPVRTGLAMFSWRMTPSVKSTYFPKLSQHDMNLSDGNQRIFPPPERPDLDKYKRINYKKFVLFNNQQYVADINQDEKKYYYQWIETGIRKALIQAKVSKA